MEMVSLPPSLCLDGLLRVTAGRWQKVERGDRASPDRLFALHTRGSRPTCPSLTRVPDSREDAKEKMRSADPCEAETQGWELRWRDGSIPTPAPAGSAAGGGPTQAQLPGASRAQLRAHR